MASINSLLFVTCMFVICCTWLNEAHGQRNLLHWKRDLVDRFNFYLNQRKIINDIVASSIYSPPQETLQGPANVFLRGNVRFTDLIIPDGALLLDRHIAQPTMRILHNKTLSYVSSKMIELDQIMTQLGTIKRQIDSPGQQLIDKGLRNMPPNNNYTFVQGTRIFKQFHYGRIIESDQVDVGQVNFTLVDKVLNDTYMDNLQYGKHDSRARLFFEGRKTFWKAVFQRPLKSGCCHRLKPLHTNRMMITSRPQNIKAPVMFQTNDPLMREPVVFRKLSTAVIYNNKLVVGFGHNQPNNSLLLRSPPENLIQLANLINIHTPQEVFKTIVFKDAFMADEVQLSPTVPNNKPSIGILSPSGLLRLDLSHDNHLLKYIASRNNSPIQHVAGTFIINSETLFMSGLEAQEVNRVDSFFRFVHENIVRIDRPANISGVVQFQALPSMFKPDGLSRSLQSTVIMRVNQNLNVGLLNGMSIPYDIFIIPPPQSPQAYQQITIRGPRHFVGQVRMDEPLQVRQLVNGMQMPEGVIPLHLNDFMGSVWASNLWFLDGIDVQHITAENGEFDDIILRDVHGDAQSLILRSMIAQLPDGTRLIKAPMRIKNLIIKGGAPNQGLLNGFKPENIIELNTQNPDTLYGKKTFLGRVEAIDCIINDINHLANWTNQLIRIDRPNTIQTVHTKLAFVPSPVGRQFLSSSIHVDQFGVEFYPNTNPTHYIRNLNFSPELFILQQALLRGMDNHTGGRYRVLDQVRLSNPARALVNGIPLKDIVTLNQPFRFADRFTMVGKVEVTGTLLANRITSSYPIDAMDLVQFDKYRIPIIGSRAPIRLNNLVLSTNNRASFVQCRFLNGIPFSEFANSIMSLTRPQTVDSNLVFGGPVNFDGFVRTQSSLNGVNNFKQVTKNLRSASYSFEDGLQCNSVAIRD